MKVPHMPKIYNPWFIAIVATLGGMLFGFDISSMSALVDTEQYLTFFNTPTGIEQGVIGSALAIGSVIGSLMAGFVSNWIGRRDSIAFSLIFWFAGTAMQTAVTGVGTLIGGRILNGICVGITSSQCPVYLAEIARKEKRGSLVIIQQLAIEFGILFMFLIGFGFAQVDGPASFRGAWAMQFIPAGLLLIGLPFLPRSPRWLAKVDRNEEALEILARIHAGGNREDPEVMAEWAEITETLRAERLAPKSWRKFVYGGMWKRTLVGFSVQAWQQLSGANVMTYYVVYIFSMAGLSGNINLIASSVQYALFIVFTGVMFFFIDRVGRRPLLVYGALAMGFCHFVVGGILWNGTVIPGGVGGNPNIPVQVEGSMANTVIAFSYLLIIFYALTLAPVCWIQAAEVWSLGTRAVGMSLAAIGNWLFNAALGLFIPPGFVNIQGGMFFIFGALCVLAAAHMFLTYPETAGKSLEEIEELFKPGAPLPWKTKPGHSRLDTQIERIREKGAEVVEIERMGSKTVDIS